MGSTPESVAQRNAAIAEVLKEVSTSAEVFSKISGNEASGIVSEAHLDLVLKTMKLLRTVRGPLDSVYAHFENGAHTGSVRALLEMGVFSALPLDGSSVKAQELAEKLKVDPVLLVRLMRCATLNGPFKETGPEEYAHTPFSQIYLVPAIAGAMSLITDEYAPAQLLMAQFFKSTGWTNPTSPSNNPYTFAHHTNGLSMWEYIEQFPDRKRAFNNAMLAQNQSTIWTVSIFPFHTYFFALNSASPVSPTKQEDVLVVDIGGGKGHVSDQIKTMLKDIPGRVILQDLPSVIDDITDPLEAVERMKYDFFTPQPIKGAYIYYIRRCLHDWSDAKCVEILSNIVPAMSSSSKLLIAEVVLPTLSVDIESAWMDITMLTFTGKERTLLQWEVLSSQVGLRIEKVWRARGCEYCVLECVKV